MSILYLRLVTGEDIIADASEDKNNTWILKYPMKVVYVSSPSKPGQFGISLMQWVPDKLVKDQTFTVAKRDILTQKETTEYLKDYYVDCIKQYTQSTDYELEVDDSEPGDFLRRAIEELTKEAIAQQKIEDDATEFVRSFFENISSNNKGSFN